MTQDTLDLAMNEIENPDTRDRAFLYWRLLTIHPSAAKSVVCSLKPLLSDDSEHLDTPVLDELISNISTLASVYHKPPSTFVKALRQKGRRERDEEEEEEKQQAEPESLLPSTGDLLGNGDLIGETPEVLPCLLPPNAESAKGLQVNGKFVTKGDTPELKFQLANHSPHLIAEFQIKIRQNIYNIEPLLPALPIQSLTPGQTASFSLSCQFNKTAPINSQPVPQIQVGLKTNLGVALFVVDLPIGVLLSIDGRQEKSAWLQLWKMIEKENYYDIVNMTVSSLQDIQTKLELNRIFLVVQRNINGQDYLYMSSKCIDGSVFLVEISQISGTSCKLCIKTMALHLSLMLAQSIQSILSSS